MRLRHIPGSEDFVANSHYVLSNPEQYKGAFSEKLFGNTNPLHIEIGMGKGQFIFEMAKEIRRLTISELSATTAFY